MAKKLGMTPENVEAHANSLGRYADSLESIASEVSRSGWASRSPSLFDLIPGASLVMTGGSILLAESAAADVRAAISSSAELLGRLRGEVASQRFTSSASDGSYILGFMSAKDAQAKFAEIMKDPGVLEEMTPMQTAALFNYLSQEQAEELWQAYPALVGNKSGVPPIIRIEANKYSAELAIKNGEFSSDAHEAYLTLVAAGEVQLVTYDPENYRIVEAINYVVWDESLGHYVERETPPTTVFTYVPGTSSSMEGFYKNDNYQNFVKALMVGHPEAAAFVYKDGLFAGEKPGSTPLFEAKDQGFALNAGETLNQFQQDMNRDTSLHGANNVAIGHSWGLANITSSEVAGADYDQVISLAGAFMPDGWVPNADTDYSHYSYADWLEAAHQVDELVPFAIIGSGDFPSENPAFDKHFYAGPNDDALLPELGWNPLEYKREIEESGEAWKENHGLIHSDKADNVAVIRDVKDEVYG